MASGIILRPCDAYVAGDTYTTYGVFGGYLTSSATSIRFYVPLDKPVLASGFTVTGAIDARGVTGTFQSSSDLSNFTVTAYVRNTGVTIYATASSAYSVTNNTPITVTGNITLTFS